VDKYSVMLPVVLNGCEPWSLTLREERRLRVFQNIVLGRTFEHKRDEVRGEGRKLHNEELNDQHSSKILLGWSNREEDMWHIWGTEEVHTEVWWGNLEEKDHLEDPDVDGKAVLRWIFRK
jgi:hypothetical protein